MNLQSIIEKIEKHDIITLFRHESPDGDAYGSQVGLRELIKSNYPHKKVYCLGKDVDDYVLVAGPLDTCSDVTVAASLAIVLDCADQARVDDQRFKTARAVMKIDHHELMEHFGEVEWVDTKASSVCEMITYLAIKAKWKINIIGANALYLGLTTDANRFLYSFSPRLFDCAKWLVQKGAEVAKVYQIIYEDDLGHAKYYGFCRYNFTLSPYGVAYNKISPELAESFGLKDHGAGTVNAMANIKGVDIWCHFTENDNGTIRAETRSKGLPVNLICNKFGGGGHIKAAGATLLNWDEVDVMLEEFEQLAFASKPYSKEVSVALDIAHRAGEIAKSYYLKSDLQIELKEDESPVTEADKAVDKFISEELKKFYPEYGLLSEESADDKSRLNKENVWIIDPIDGTKDFIAHDDEFSINIALVHKHEVVVGVIAVPMKDVCYYAMKGAGTYKKEAGKISRIAVSKATSDFIATKSHFHGSREVDKFYKQFASLIKEEKAYGSAYKFGLIAEGKGHINYKTGNNTKEWDIAPGVLIVQEAGGSFTKVNGEEWTFNRVNVINEGGYLVLNRPNKEFFRICGRKGVSNGKR